ncbi:DUF1476 domain-containing protein [Salinarimonas ramus]|uniref:Aldolase n=1 Tax=Salinarimonas ramus TaxID=690164 RepID=A0A917Q8R9_9HYPH|nr:DUF1476 domain-containing protein [Salinarimonas ramus]GGK35416.1 aldolase [Salinarimonas ramus]
MTTFDDREAAFENKFAHDEALRFKAIARRDRLVGLWAAEILGKTGEDAEAYARSVVSADLKKPGDAEVYEQLRADLPASVSDAEIRKQMLDLLARAVHEVESA